MFMDTDGDGVFSQADRLKPNGTPTTVDVWVSTLRTPTGAPTVCNTLDGSLGTWNSYAANIAVSGGTVTFGTPTNRQSTFDIPVVPFEFNDAEMAYGQAGLPITAGLQRMFTMEVTGQSGDPSLSFMSVGHFVPSPTSFGTPCSGLDYDNTYKLGTDWVDAFGALPNSAPPPANLVGNPSFEISTAGWAGLDGATIQRVEGGHDGGYSVEVRGPAGSPGKFSVNDSPNWVEAAPAARTVYQFSAWVRSATVAGNAQLRVRQYLNRIHQGTWYSPTVKLGPSWQRVTMGVPAVAAGATLDLQVMDAPVAAGEVFQADDISIQILPSGSAASFASFESVEFVEMEAVMAPNPLNPEAVLSFTTREAGPIQVHVYSATGRRVRTLSESAAFPGRQAVRFNGTDASGRRLASGVYFYRIEAGTSRATGRFVVLK
jgi:hypothetical protein